ncbi:MAG: response regulator [Candidatus Omnitrophica bacterium]|nr:response regulator [Candidatus Omnitrophota bacterium]MBU1996902.1 response regulator [Candidatus Omnitrophota bacterium]MBU4333930.1 response regulator [Candidatus Omnitrophota bacterium]
MKILIVDDSLLDRKLLMNVLKKAGFENEILQASNGEEGIKMMYEYMQEICLIFLDWQMPNMDGIEVLKLTRNISYVKDIPIIMVTASGSEANKKVALDANPDLAGYVVKPYTASSLIRTVEPYLK